MRIIFMFQNVSHRAYFKPQKLADTLAAYLLGADVFRQSDARSLGPYNKPDREYSWQLEHGNNYFLHYDPVKHEGVLSARYDTDHERELMKTLAQLFTLRYEIPHRIDE